ILYSSRHRRDLHSFPTRRSSDLCTRACSQTLPGKASATRTQASRCPTKVASHCTAAWDSNPSASSRPWGASSENGTTWPGIKGRSEEHTSELQSLRHLVCRLLLE